MKDLMRSVARVPTGWGVHLRPACCWRYREPGRCPQIWFGQLPNGNPTEDLLPQSPKGQAQQSRRPTNGVVVQYGRSLSAQKPHYPIASSPFGPTTHEANRDPLPQTEVARTIRALDVQIETYLLFVCLINAGLHT